MAVHDHTYGHLLEVLAMSEPTVLVKVVQVPRSLLEMITIVNRGITVKIVVVILLQFYIPVILSGMVQSVKTKALAAALLRGSL